MQYIKADTNTEVLIGPVVAVGDGFTPVTTLSLSTADEAEIIKYGGATPLTVTSISANGFAAITSADGYYTLDISTGNSDTEGFLTVLINDDSLCLPIRVDFMVVNANVYDSLFAAATTDYLQTDVAQWLGTAAATPTTAGVPSVALTAIGLDAIGQAATGIVEIAKAVWDRVLTGGTHNINNSAGKRLRQIDAAFEVHSGTAQAGTGTSITLDTGASATDNIYNGDRVIIISGTGAQEHDIITAYNGTTKVATVAETWVITPDATSEFILVPASVDIETWQHIPVTNGATTSLPCVDAASISDNTAAADNVQSNIGNLDAPISTAQTDLDTITGADGATLATAQPSITFQPLTITAGDAINNITLAGTGTSDGIAFTRSGAGDPFDANFIGQINSTVDTALTDYDAATGTELAATEAKIDIIDTNVDAVLVDTATTIPATLATLATAASLATTDGKVDTIDAIVDAILVDTGTDIPALITTLDAVADAIKAKTDSLTFTKANELDANAQSINGVTLTGDGDATPFDVV